jgi:NTP pyrophosphatase (non-canonical NTP hydrolase)
MELSAVTQRAMQIRQGYAQLEQQRYGRSWTPEEVALGFVGDIGDLVKLVMAQSGVRAIADSRAKLAHELADCLWSVCVLAELYQIDLEQAFLDTMVELEQHIAAEIAPVSQPRHTDAEPEEALE